jgi:hypothetical protein
MRYSSSLQKKQRFAGFCAKAGVAAAQVARELLGSVEFSRRRGGRRSGQRHRLFAKNPMRDFQQECRVDSCRKGHQYPAGFTEDAL